jgi:hypothetical protein
MASNKKAGRGSAPDRSPKPQPKGAGESRDTRPVDPKRSASSDRGRAAASRPARGKPASTKPAAGRSALATRLPAKKAAKPAPRPTARTAKGRPLEAKRSAAPARGNDRSSKAPSKKGRSGKAKPAKLVSRDPQPATGSPLSEEETIRSAKYLPRELPPRLFEEERFLFPETYGVNRVRLLVRDPEWLFAYWDVNPSTMKDMGKSLGERTLAVSRLTLRIADPVSGGSSDILLPAGARWWYVRTDSTPRSYRAELGLTLPSGEFRRLAESNTVVTPRVGPSPQRVTRRVTYPQAGPLSVDAATPISLDDPRSAGSANAPWSAPSIDATKGTHSGTPDATSNPKGGASDAYRPGGASDVHRR